MKKGYTKIENKILEFLMKAEMNCTDIKVFLAIIRYTYGFGRDECTITASYISDITGKSLRNVQESLKNLCDMGVIEKRKADKYNRNCYKILPVDKYVDK